MPPHCYLLRTLRVSFFNVYMQQNWIQLSPISWRISSSAIFSRVSDCFMADFSRYRQMSNSLNFRTLDARSLSCQETNTQWCRVTPQTNGDQNCTAAKAWQLASLTFALTSDAEIQSEFCKEIILILVQYSLKLQFTIITQAQFYAPETGLMTVGLNWL